MCLWDAKFNSYISFYAPDLPAAVSLCSDSEVYYMMGSGNLSQELLDQVMDNSWFLGCIGPDDQTDYSAGADMAAAYASRGSQSPEQPHFLVVTGGAAYGNHMHEMRAKGILDTLAASYGYQYSQNVDEIVMAEAPLELETGVDGVTVSICPGYDVPEKLPQSLELCRPDAVLSVLASDSLVPLVTEAEHTYNSDIWVGVVDCFSQWNQELFQKEDEFGNSSLNYVAGKYASEVGPAFAAMFQAVTDGAEMLRPDGKAFHLNQGFWTADNADTYNELYQYTQSLVFNAYSAENLMEVLRVYQPEADFEAFRKLTEAYSAEAVLQRVN